MGPLPGVTYEGTNLTQNFIIRHAVALVGKHVGAEAERNDILALVLALLEANVVPLNLGLALAHNVPANVVQLAARHLHRVLVLRGLVCVSFLPRAQLLTSPRAGGNTCVTNATILFSRLELIMRLNAAPSAFPPTCESKR